MSETVPVSGSPRSTCAPSARWSSPRTITNRSPIRVPTMSSRSCRHRPERRAGPRNPEGRHGERHELHQHPHLHHHREGPQRAHGLGRGQGHDGLASDQESRGYDERRGQADLNGLSAQTLRITLSGAGDVTLAGEVRAPRSISPAWGTYMPQISKSPRSLRIFPAWGTPPCG